MQTRVLGYFGNLPILPVTVFLVYLSTYNLPTFLQPFSGEVIVPLIVNKQNKKHILIFMHEDFWRGDFLI